MNDIDLDALLSPISDTQPCGEDMQFSGEFDTIRDMRRSDDPTLDQGVWVRDLKVANYLGVRQLSTQLLATRTKDIRLCGWLTEAYARLDGFAGMAAGLECTGAISERFWEGIYPLADGDDQDERIGNINWLLKQIEELGATLPLVKTEDKSLGRRVIEAARASQSNEQDDERRQQAEEVQAAIQKMAGPQVLSQIAAIQGALTQLEALQTLLDVRLGDDGPSFSSARQSLQDTEHLLKRIAKEKGLVSPTEATDHTSTTDHASDNSATQAHTPHAAPGVLTNRNQALAQLRAVSEFFRRTEPHSPVAYLAEKAARWGEVPLHQWLRTVVKDPQVLGNLEELLGVEPPPGDRDNSY
jgi:type VI secretion system protein ImpA